MQHVQGNFILAQELITDAEVVHGVSPSGVELCSS